MDIRFNSKNGSTILSNDFAKIEALNSQNEFFKELMWVQRGLVSVNWTKATDEAKSWVKKIPEILPAEKDFSL